MFSGLSAFPLTPMNETRIDEAAFVGLIERLTTAGVDSIGALGSTGSYAYLTREERARVAKIAVEHATGNTDRAASSVVNISLQHLFFTSVFSRQKKPRDYVAFCVFNPSDEFKTSMA
ncbi:dihydrodipicolinate synthase family protein [Vibrio furnissii]|uniref:dihydrodipicolinate synthase family protein n=1 Tax=Vibrio furnissii TaxID=29494 RepID=UPI001E58DB14|nr:dihydrodipicolinate synthase family protein [Vibrio furnissii]UHJ58989.1 dihydrodipicolinate synthase family protein [Vibrio furnissii]